MAHAAHHQRGAGDLPQAMTSSGQIEVVLQPGEFYFGDRHTRIRTLLGSCVAITLWHPRRLIGGMCHFMLPTRGGIPQHTHPHDGHYGDEAMVLLLEKIAACGTQLQEYEAKVFGGGNMFAEASKARLLDVGERNIESAHRLLGHHRVQAGASCVGKNGYRNVLFDIATGYVWVRHVSEATSAP
jgi:chemotaxis protein CheD